MAAFRVICRQRSPLILGLTFFSSIALAAPAAREGAAIAQHGAAGGVLACMSCHGAKGEGNPAAGFPRLAGLPTAYLAAQLHSFANGSRTNGMMGAIAKALNGGQIAALADYYGHLPVPQTPYGAEPAAAQAGLGQRLAERGDWNAGIPSCFRCHGPGGVGVAPGFPPVVGQPASYIEAQIKAWKTGSRHNDPQGLMHTVAARMSDADTQAVAAWLAAQKPSAPKAH